MLINMFISKGRTVLCYSNARGCCCYLLSQKYLPVFRIAAVSNVVNMASALGRLARLSALRSGRTPQLTPSVGPGRTVTPLRTAVCTSSGAILPKPVKVSAAFKGRCGVWKLRLYQPRTSWSFWTNWAVSVAACVTPGKQTSFGLFRIALVVVPFLYVGTQISKNFAALLEEHDIFVPEDDDDDDWGMCRLPGYQVSPVWILVFSVKWGHTQKHTLGACASAVHKGTFTHQETLLLLFVLFTLFFEASHILTG